MYFDAEEGETEEFNDDDIVTVSDDDEVDAAAPRNDDVITILAQVCNQFPDQNLETIRNILDACNYDTKTAVIRLNERKRTSNMQTRDTSVHSFVPSDEQKAPKRKITSPGPGPETGPQMKLTKSLPESSGVVPKRHTPEEIESRIITILGIFPQANDRAIRHRLAESADLDTVVPEVLHELENGEKMEEGPGPSKPPEPTPPVKIDRKMEEHLSEEDKENLVHVTHIFPDVDPNFVFEQIAIHRKTLEDIVNEMINNSSYPKLKQSLEKERQERRRHEFLSREQFDIEAYLHVFEEPESYFNDQTRNTTDLYVRHAKVHLLNLFRNMREDFVQRQLLSHNNHFLPTHRTITEGISQTGADGRRRKPRNFGMAVYNGELRPISEWPDEIDEMFFRELQYFEHQDKIREYMAERNRQRELREQEAQMNGGDPLSFVPAYIIVCDLEGGTPVEIPLNEDKTLALSTLQIEFTDATGIKYRNPDTGIFRIVVPQNGKLYPSAGGWGNHHFIACQPKSADEKPWTNESITAVAGVKRVRSSDFTGNGGSSPSGTFATGSAATGYVRGINRDFSDDKQAEFDSMRRDIQCILITAKNGRDYRELEKDYIDLTGDRIPVGYLGFKSTKELIHFLSDIVSIRRINGRDLLFGIPDAKTAHISKLVVGQKQNKTSRFGGSLPPKNRKTLDQTGGDRILERFGDSTGGHGFRGRSGSRGGRSKSPEHKRDRDRESRKKSSKRRSRSRERRDSDRSKDRGRSQSRGRDRDHDDRKSKRSRFDLKEVSNSTGRGIAMEPNFEDFVSPPMPGAVNARPARATTRPVAQSGFDGSNRIENSIQACAGRGVDSRGSSTGLYRSGFGNTNAPVFSNENWDEEISQQNGETTRPRGQFDPCAGPINVSMHTSQRFPQNTGFQTSTSNFGASQKKETASSGQRFGDGGFGFGFASGRERKAQGGDGFHSTSSYATNDIYKPKQTGFGGFDNPGFSESALRYQNRPRTPSPSPERGQKNRGRGFRGRGARGGGFHGARAASGVMRGRQSERLSGSDKTKKVARFRSLPSQMKKRYMQLGRLKAITHDDDKAKKFGAKQAKIDEKLVVVEYTRTAQQLAEKKQRNKRSKKKTPKCRKCQLNGHSAPDCPSELTCGKCKETGHTSSFHKMKPLYPERPPDSTRRLLRGQKSPRARARGSANRSLVGESNAKRMMEPDDLYHDTSEGATKQKRLERENERKCSDLIVLGLPYNTTSSQLREYFEHFGGVVVSEIKFDHKTGKHTGFGVVRFEDLNSEVKVLAQLEHFIDGRKCEVKISNSNSATMFVGRVQDDMTADDLRSFFISEAKGHSPNSEVIDVIIPKPFRASAFVTFSDPDICQRIINTQDYVINGQSVCVSPAAPEDVVGGTGDMRSPGGGRYSSGSGSRRGSFVRHSPLSSHGHSSSHYQRIPSSSPGDNIHFPSSDYSGYGASPRTMGPMGQGPRVVQPPRSQQSRGVTNGGDAAGSSALASDMDQIRADFPGKVVDLGKGQIGLVVTNTKQWEFAYKAITNCLCEKRVLGLDMEDLKKPPDSRNYEYSGNTENDKLRLENNLNG